VSETQVGGGRVLDSERMSILKAALTYYKPETPPTSSPRRRWTNSPARGCHVRQEFLGSLCRELRDG
jgi:hypothetical protein